MPYVPFTWLPGVAGGTMVTATRLNHMETGIETATGTDWASYTPTLTNITIGNGSVAAKWQKVGKIGRVQIVYTHGSSGATMGTIPRFSLPAGAQPVSFAAASAMNYRGYLLDAGTNRLNLLMQFDGATGVGVYVESVLSTYLIRTDITATIPFTWAVGDQIVFWLEYECA